ncbi:MAG: hypothetical protein IK131_12115 [Paludibacteraceae bacterium]|nr:hypothetical protein [Paludibacteraceae bacterium]
MERFKVVFIRVILAIMILSLNSGCGSQKELFRKNQVQGVTATGNETKNDTIALVQGIDFDVPEVGRIILSDMSVERVRSIQCPILKLIGTDGQQLVVSKGLCYVCSAFPDGLFYLLDESNRVKVAEGNRLYLLSGRLKISEVPSWLLFPDVNQEIMNH